MGAPSSPICLSSCPENPFFSCVLQLSAPVLVLSPRHSSAWAARNPPGENLCSSPFRSPGTPPPPSQRPPFAPFPGFHPKPAGFTPPALALCPCPARGGVWDHPDPAGILRNAPGAVKGAPGPAAGAAEPPAAPAWVGKAGLNLRDLGPFPAPSHDKSPAILRHPRCWGGWGIHPWIGRGAVIPGSQILGVQRCFFSQELTR